MKINERQRQMMLDVVRARSRTHVSDAYCFTAAVLCSCGRIAYAEDDDTATHVPEESAKDYIFYWRDLTGYVVNEECGFCD